MNLLCVSCPPTSERLINVRALFAFTLALFVLFALPKQANASGGSYTLKYAAADPGLYIPPIPYPPLTAPTGSGHGHGQCGQRRCQSSSVTWFGSRSATAGQGGGGHGQIAGRASPVWAS